MAASSSSTADTRASTLLINRGFALLWSGQVVTDLGTVIFNTTLVLWVGALLARGATWAPLAVSGLVVAASVPMVLVRPVAGVYVDRWDARRTMLVMDALRLALNALLIIVAAVQTIPLAWRFAAIYIAVLLVSICTQFFNTALLMLIRDLVSEADLPRASGLSEITWNAASVVGPPLAAPLVFGAGIEWALVVNATSFAVSFLSLALIRAQMRSVPATAKGERQHLFRELWAGLRFCADNAVVRTVTVALILAMLGAGAFHVLDYFFVTQNLHAAPAVYGLVGPAFGAGSVLGALLAGRVTSRLGAARTLWLSMLGVGLAIMLLARQTSLIPALVVYMLFGIVNSGANVALMPLLLGATPRELVGRMNALFFTAISAASLISSALSGWLASTVLHGLRVALLGMVFGPVDTILTGTGLLICVGGLYAMARLTPAAIAHTV